MTATTDRRPVVLVVDDASLVRAYHEDVLADAGFEVHHAANGYEALERAVSQAYDLMLVDVNMPVMDGYSCVASVRRQAVNPAVPIVMISTEREEADAETAYRAGANLYLVKPVAPEQLVLTARVLTRPVRAAACQVGAPT